MRSTIRHLVAVGITVAFLLVVGLIAGEQTSPVAAQGPSGQFVGKPITAARMAVVNFSQVSANGVKSPVRTSRRAIRSPRFPGQRPSVSSPLVTPGLAPAQAPARTLSPSPAASFAGLDDDGTVIPPDTTGAVGPNHLMVTLNNNIGIQNRSGSLVTPTVTLFSFWQAVLPPNSTGPFDPSVLYDPFNNRWIHVVATDDGSSLSSVCVAVSQTSDPTGNWNRFCFSADNTSSFFADFPRLGFDHDWIVVSVNMFPLGSGSVHGQVFAFNKANLYNNIGTGHFVFGTSIPFTLVPSVTLDDTLSTEYFVRQTDCTSCNTIAKSALVGSAPLTPTLSIDTAIVTSNLSSWAAVPPSLNFLPQAPPSVGKGTLGIDPNDDNMLDAVVRTVNGVTSIWCSQTIFLPVASPTHAAAQWWQLDGGTVSSSTVLQQGRVEDPAATTTNGGKHFAYPSITVNRNGDMLIGYSQFSSSSYASAAYSFRQAGDPSNTTRDRVIFKTGLDYYEETYGVGDNRWGDFSNTVIDPLNDTDMWTIQEYAKHLGGTPGTDSDPGRWGTWWAKVHSPNTVTTITANLPNPSKVGESVTVSITVTVVPPSGGTPTGNVTISDGTIQCGVPLPATSCGLTFATAGFKSLTAIYSGDSNFDTSTSYSVIQSVIGKWYFPIIGK